MVNKDTVLLPIAKFEDTFIFLLNPPKQGPKP